jgi:aspartate carbamoyltransferase catalytic subunit
LGAEVINLDIASSSVKKGETLADTVRTINAMGVDALIIRHDTSFVPREMAALVDCAVINAGDGTHEHPTQGLLDAFTIRQRKGAIAGLTVAICGDIRHSRVAHSNMHALSKLGATLRLIGPAPFLPVDPALPPCAHFTDMAAGLQGADVVMMLRIQFERLAEAPDLAAYRAAYCLDRARLALAKPNALVLHPGPLNRMIEIADTVADDAQQSGILTQVKNGVFTRMAVLERLIAHRTA